MRQRAWNLSNIILLFVLTLLPIDSGASDAVIKYDAQNDALTVKTVGTDIEYILSEISVQAGMRIFIDPEVQKIVTINLEDVPLESALHQIARGLSYALFYESGMRKQRVVGMRLVPKGQPGSGPLKELGRSSYQLPKEALSYTGGEEIEYTDDGSVQKKTKRHAQRRSNSEQANDASVSNGEVRTGGGPDEIPVSGAGVAGHNSSGSSPDTDENPDTDTSDDDDDVSTQSVPVPEPSDTVPHSLDE